MAEKTNCKLCGDKIDNTFLEKVNGTIVKIRKDDKNEKYYVCSNCQKKHRDLRKEIEKTL